MHHIFETNSISQCKDVTKDMLDHVPFVLCQSRYHTDGLQTHAHLPTSAVIFFSFQPQAPDAVAGALAAAQILRELSHVETETEEVAAMKDLAMHFENLAIGERWEKG
uniref:TRPM-like domain-containing protein n=1 Tax=Micrurus surinamensis TaxID=129470 RepID=A0A2D4PK09_MICSU